MCQSNGTQWKKLRNKHQYKWYVCQATFLQFKFHFYLFSAITFKEKTYLKKEISSNAIRSILRENITLSFRTHEHSALLLYAHDIYNNFIRIYIVNGSSVVFSFNYYSKIVVQPITIGKLLQSGYPVQLKISRLHYNSTVFTVNKNSVVIPFSVKSTKDTLSFSDQVNNNELFIGGLDSNDSNSGFVGCIQGLMIGYQLIDLETMAKEIQAKNDSRKNMIKAGCKMLCDDLPCNNGGICTENWQNGSTNCDCESTSYRGDTCNIDIGAYFEKDSSVAYLLDDGVLDFTHIDITFAFSTSFTESSTLLMIRYANSSRFLHIAIINGNLFVEEDNGQEICELIFCLDKI